MDIRTAGSCEQGSAHVNKDGISKLVPLDSQLQVTVLDAVHQNAAFQPVRPSSKNELVDHSHNIALDPDSLTSSPENLPLLAQSHQHTYLMESVPPTTLIQPQNVVQRDTACTWLSSILGYIYICYRWMLMFAALALYAFFLMPGILRVAWLYFFDKRIHRNIAYGPGPRNKLDLYLLENLGTPKPVIAFVTGGAWIIGYKAWGSLLGLQLVDEDVIVACIDYRNYPGGTIGDMVEDVSQAISFICNNIASYGGDLNRLFLVGQSAGAHIAACVLIEQAKKEMDRGDVEIANQENAGNDTSLAWKASQFQAYIGLSGGYNLLNLMDHFRRRGFYQRLFFGIMEGEGSLLRYSPELRLQSLGANARFLLPPVYLFHGDCDSSIPCNSSTSFAEALTSVGVQATAKIYEGKTHTDLFLQDPMRGGYDPVLTDILLILYGEHRMHSQDASSDARRRMVPEVCLQFAHRISPF